VEEEDAPLVRSSSPLLSLVPSVLLLLLLEIHFSEIIL
jgi:hypothetical protein